MFRFKIVNSVIWSAALLSQASFLAAQNPPEPLCTNVYIGPRDGDRFDSKNWLPTLPTANDIACDIADLGAVQASRKRMSPRATNAVPPTTIGACCLGSTCIITDAFDCSLNDGHFVPGVVLCTENICATGACCHVDPSCEDTGGSMDQFACEVSGGNFVGGALCDESDPCQRFRLPPGFEIVLLRTDDPPHSGTNLNDCGEVVFFAGTGELNDLHIFYCDNGKMTQITDGRGRYSWPDINDFGVITWSDLFGDVVLMRNGVVEFLGEANVAAPDINEHANVSWDVRFPALCPDLPHSEIRLFRRSENQLISDDGFDARGPKINNSDNLIWTRYDNGSCEFNQNWESEILLYVDDTIQILPNILSQCQAPRFNDQLLAVWSCAGGSEIWENGQTTLFATEDNQANSMKVNELRTIFFGRFFDDVGRWEKFLYIPGNDPEYFRLTENGTWDLGGDINNANECAWHFASNPNVGPLEPWGVRYMRRIRNGDVNWDGVVDLEDFVPMPGCFTGSVDTDRLCQCRFYDMDHDRDVDEDDLALFLRVYSTDSPDPLADCNKNGIGDFEDLLTGVEVDLNFNGLPDACELAADPNLDLDGDGLLDDICSPTSPILSATGTRNRYLTFKTGEFNPARLPGMGEQGQPVPLYHPLQAIRIRVTATPTGHESLIGQTLWVAESREVCENSGQGFDIPIDGCGPAPGQPGVTFMIAGLQCDPVFANWLELGDVNVYHQSIIPGATYAIEVINEGCALATAANYSPALVVSNPIWGDVVENCSSLPCPGPDNRVDVVTDVTAVLEKFRNLATTPAKSRADLEPTLPDGQINISDVTFVLNAFGGADYPFTPTATPCP